MHQGLKAKLDATDVVRKLAINEAVGTVEKQRDELKNGLDRSELWKQLPRKWPREKTRTQIKDREE